MTDTILADVILGPCRGCGRTRVNQKVFALKPQYRQQGFVRGNAFELCTGCYSRARRLGTLPDPAPAGPPATPRAARTQPKGHQSHRMTIPQTNHVQPRVAITNHQLALMAQNLRRRHNLGTWDGISWEDQQDWLAITRKLLRGTGIEVRS